MITKETVQEIQGKIDRLITQHRDDIVKRYMEVEKFKIAVTVSFKGDQATVKINYPQADKFEDSVFVALNQPELPMGE